MSWTRVDAGLLNVLLHGEDLDEGHYRRDVALGLKREVGFLLLQVWQQDE